MPQLEENLLSRLARLEKMLEAYRKLHADELTEIGRELAELRRDMEALAKASTLTADQPAPGLTGLARNAETADLAR